jgi:hypothetical protein
VVVGQNLSRRHGTNQTYACIRRAGGGFTSLPVISVNPYRVACRLPVDLPEGTHELWLHNGDGGVLGWSGPLQLIAAKPWLRGNFTLKLLPSGGDDAPAFNAALSNVAARADGGTLQLAPGTYMISSLLRMQSKVRVLGAGRTNTILRMDNGKLVEYTPDPVRPGEPTIREFLDFNDKWGQPIAWVISANLVRHMPRCS